MSRTFSDSADMEPLPVRAACHCDILRGDHPVFAGLRMQLARCEVSEREFTGVGFFTTLAIPADVPLVPLDRRLALGDVHATMNGVEHGVGLVLFVDEGRLALLEGFTYDGAWPDQIKNYRINPGRDRAPGRLATDLEQADAASAGPDAVS